MTDAPISNVHPVTIPELFAAHDNAEAVQKIRDWCISTTAPSCWHDGGEHDCDRCEAIRDCGLAVLSLLPVDANT